MGSRKGWRPFFVDTGSEDSENSKGLKKDTTVFIIMFGLICVLLRVQFCNFVRFKYY